MLNDTVRGQFTPTESSSGLAGDQPVATGKVDLGPFRGVGIICEWAGVLELGSHAADYRRFQPGRRTQLHAKSERRPQA